jgi:hypothetical protein
MEERGKHITTFKAPLKMNSDELRRKNSVQIARI